MHSLYPYSDTYEDDRLHLGLSLTSPYHQNLDASWTPVDPALYNLQSKFQSEETKYRIPFFQSSSPATTQFPPTTESFDSTRAVFRWAAPVEQYEYSQYNSPHGHFGGSLSESSSEYALSPDVTRQHTIHDPARYLSPPVDNQVGHPAWPANAVFMPTPGSPRSSVHTPATTIREPEFTEMSEYQLECHEGDTLMQRVQLPINIPEELDLSDSIATLTTASRVNTGPSLSSNCGSSSSASSPAHDNDSDSDFNPRGHSGRSATSLRHACLRSPRRLSTTYPTLDPKSRVYKPSNLRSSSNREKPRTKIISPTESASNLENNTRLPRSFPCTFHLFGCPSTFANKNEWKRHITSQHLQLGFYRCDLGICNPENTTGTQYYTQVAAVQGNRGRGRGHHKRRSISTSQNSQDEGCEQVKVYNDFNRKDLFTQHCRRMHGPARHLVDSTTQTNQNINARRKTQGRKAGSAKPINTKEDEHAFEEELEQIRSRCWKVRRFAPERSSCGFCGRLFEASVQSDESNMRDGRAEEKAWEDRMEHLGRHYERDGCSPTMEGVDQDLLDWGLREGILTMLEDVGAWLVGYDTPCVEEEEEEQRREGLRRRGPRRKVSAREDDLIKIETPPTTADATSDDDAMAEDD